MFIGAEIMLFGTLFAGYFVLVDRTGNGPTGAEILKLHLFYLKRLFF